MVNTLNRENITLSFSKGAGSTDPAYYETEVRLYAKGTLTVTSPYTIKEIIFDGSLNKTQNTLSSDVGTFTNTSSIGSWKGESENVVFTVGHTSGHVKIKGITVMYDLPEGSVTVAVPTISPASDMFDLSKEVTITPADATHTVWYTTDGSEPEVDGATSTEYTVPLTITATTTVKAIAVDADGNASSVASATYTKKEWLENLSALVAKIKEDNNTSGKEYYVNLTGAVVTGVLGTYAAYLEEDEIGVYLNKSSHGLTLAQKYSGKATVSAKMNNGIPQLTAFECATVEENAELPLATITLAELTDNFEAYLSRRVKIADAVTITELNTKATGEIMQGDVTINVYPNTTITTAIAENHKVDIVGWPTLFNSAQQLNVWAEEDITDKGLAFVLYFSADAISVRIDGDVTEPTLENTYDEAPVYSSSNTEVATVDATTGEVTILAEGETTITATLTSADKTASYTLTVTGLPIKTDGNYYLLTSKDELVLGARYLIAGVKNNVTVVMSTTQNSNNRGQVEVTKDGDDVITSATGAQEIVLCAGTVAGQYALNVGGAYLYAASSSKNYLRTQETLDDNGQATIDVDGTTGNATIVFQGDNTNNCLRYNSGNSIFSCYASTSTMALVQLYKLYTENQGEFSIGVDGFASFYTEEAFVMPQGVEGGIITEAVDNKLTISYAYPSGATVPAKTPLLLKGAQGKYAYDITTSEAVAPADNLLRGAEDVDTDGNVFVSGTSVKYYALSKDADGNNLGFYWMADNGATFPYQAGKAFLAIDGAAGSVFKLFDSNVTGIESIDNGQWTMDNGQLTIDNAPIYDLSGRKVLAPAKGGIYVKNGKKFIVK